METFRTAPPSVYTVLAGNRIGPGTGATFGDVLSSCRSFEAWTGAVVHWMRVKVARMRQERDFHRGSIVIAGQGRIE